MTDHDPVHVVAVARDRWVGLEFERHVGRWVGHDLAIDDDTVVAQFREVGRGDIFGVRLPLPVLPREGMAYRDVRMRTADDWLSDVLITLQEEVATGLMSSGERVQHPDWTELALSFDPWKMEPSEGPLGDWADPPARF